MKFLEEILTFWSETWEQDKSLFFAEALGTITALASATFLSFFSGQHLTLIFISYIISNLSFIYAAYVRKSSWILLMSVGFIILNIYGIIKIHIL